MTDLGAVGNRRLVTVWRQVGSGLTQEVAGVFKFHPARVFSLRDVLSLIRPGAVRGEVQSILHKMVRDKGVLVVSRVTVPWGGSVRVVAAYKWRLPSDPQHTKGGP